ncbi:PREDICTED: cyclic AMP-dependent transcription factor ATF-4-like [Nanorana parkeri]|uniref:cyclic AMP-dependent transcription factor ATF-4-like n=1 Tax=Nanorana parkeri TaxID=125878 RepID=UPI000854E8A8|nr:PREDICTED: cyclic AMP-dependent transcription factor ATF-4-like [Nanorana parkeri]
MNLLSDDLMLGDFLSPLNQSFLAAEESLGLLDDCIEVSGYLPSHGFSSKKAKNGVSELLPLAEPFGSFQGDTFSGMDWMVEKMDLKEFDFDSLLGMEDLEATVSPDELMATLDDSCDLLEDPPLPLVFGQYVPSPAPVSLPGSPLEADQVAPVSPSLAESNISSPNHSFILDVGSEVDVAEEDNKSVIYTLEVPKFEKEDSSDNDSGICMSPLLKSEKEDSSDNDSEICMSPSYLGSTQQSPAFTVEYPSSAQSSPASPNSERPKPYDLSSKDKEVLAKVKSVGQPRVDKKKKKMEQNKTAATRYRQKKKAEQDIISVECRALEQKNDSLKEKADSIAKEIQYLKDLIEEVRKAKSKRAKSS